MCVNGRFSQIRSHFVFCLNLQKVASCSYAVYELKIEHFVKASQNFIISNDDLTIL